MVVCVFVKMNLITLFSFILLSLLITSSRVNAFTGGANATFRDISEIVSLRNILKDGQLFGSGHYCGGAVYSDTAFLTSASCLSDTA